MSIPHLSSYPPPRLDTPTPCTECQRAIEPFYDGVELVTPQHRAPCGLLCGGGFGAGSSSHTREGCPRCSVGTATSH